MSNNINKCPQCGEPIESFQTRCSACGFELKEQKVSKALQEFFVEIGNLDDKIYDARKSDKARKYDLKEKKVEKKLKKKKSIVSLFFLYFIMIPMILALLAAILDELSFYISYNPVLPIIIAVAFVLVVIGAWMLYQPRLSLEEKRKKSYILDFPVPATRADLLEFAAFASGKIEEVSKIGRLFSLKSKKTAIWNKIWGKKCQQIYIKASIAMVDDPFSLAIIKTIFANSNVTIK